MAKRGDIRSDGKVFLQSNKNCIGGEYWVEMDHFLKMVGEDYYEKAEKRREYLAEMARTKDERKEALRDRQRKRSREYQAKRRRENPEQQREADRRHHARRKGNPDYIRRCKESWRRYYLKKNGARIEARKAARAAKEKEKQDKAKARIAELARKKAEREAKIAMRTPRVILTSEERLERKRQEKRNYKHRRRAILRGQEAKATAKQIREAKEKAGGRCFYCSECVENLTIDHVVPICNGGTHTLDNIVFACHSCNSWKSGSNANEFGRRFGLLLV